MEKICLAIPTELLFKEKKFEGYKNKEFYDYLPIILNPKNQKFLLRNSVSENQKIPAEKDPSYKQPIAYIILLYKNKLFLYERAPKEASSETRLASKLSIGIGGHIEPHDFNNKKNILTSSLKREIEEETGLKEEDYQLKQLGYLYSETNEVDLVHFGLIYLAKIENNKVKIDQTELIKGSFIDISKLKKKEIYERLEGWSKILVGNMHKISTIF